MRTRPGLELEAKEVFVVVVQEGIEELVVIEELLEDPELAELENCDALSPLYHVECIGLHIRSFGQGGVTCIPYPP